MKKVLIGFILMSFFTVISCEKDKIDIPGNIPGMGNTKGELQIKQKYELPKGINIVGEITGVKSGIGKTGEIINNVWDAKTDCPIYGSGGFVRLKLNLLNYRNYPITVFFSKGLIFKCNFGGFQESMCGQTTWACIPPNTLRSIYLDLYCLNKGIPSPDNTGKYSILGITASKTMWDLLNLIGWRKINYEMCFPRPGKGIEAEPAYEEIIERMQTVIHNLTNYGSELSADDIAFIQNIPELSESEIPSLDVNLQYPEYFDEFVVQEK